MGRTGRPERLDLLLVRRGLAASRQRARELITEGVVHVDGLPMTKPGARVRTDQNITLSKGDFPWVSRGALKLLGALEQVSVRISGRVAADLGASTGGFTQVLLERGAERVYAIDVGRGQLAWKLRTDDRVVVMDGVNARHLESLPEAVDLVVGDLSFISLELVLPAIQRITRPGADVVILVKPQFEAGREGIARGGVVRDAETRLKAIARVRDAARGHGFRVEASIDSTLPGAKSGNIEHFLHMTTPTTILGEP